MRRSLSANEIIGAHSRRRRHLLPAVLFCLGLLLGPAGLMGQEPVTLRTAAQATTGRTYVSAVQELRDGRLVVVDMLDRSVLLYGADLDSLGVIGRTGQGPNEYGAPRGLAMLPDGRVLVQDAANGRFMVLTAAGELSGEVLTAADLPTTRLVSMGQRPLMIDAQGRWYYSTGFIAVPNGTRAEVDSTGIERWSGQPGEAGRRIDAYPFWGSTGPTLVSALPPGVAQVRSSWAACNDGTVYIADASRYTIAVHRSGGERVEHGPFEYTAVRPSDAFKAEWAARVSSQPTMTLSMAAGGGSSIRYVTGRPSPGGPWPSSLPPFAGDATDCGPANRAWVKQTVDAGQPPRIDVFDQTGTRIQRFDLPMGARIVGFGEASVSVVVRDDFDLEYLTRLEVPIG